jgi:hypothetical protein
MEPEKLIKRKSDNPLLENSFSKSLFKILFKLGIEIIQMAISVKILDILLVIAKVAYKKRSIQLRDT